MYVTVPSVVPLLVKSVLTEDVCVEASPASVFELAFIFGQPEIQNLGVPAFGDKNIGGLDVAVDDPLGVGGVECVRDTRFRATTGFQFPADDLQSGVSESARPNFMAMKDGSPYLPIS